MTTPVQLLSHRDRRIGMTPGATTGEQREDPRCRCPCAHDARARTGPSGACSRVRAGPGTAWRAMLATTPTLNIVITSGVPPTERNGRGTPETGSTPTTAPRLIAACP